MKYKYVAWSFVILWMSVIFYLSHQPGSASSELSNGVMQIVLQTIEQVVPSATFDVEQFHHFIRKNAHFFAYFVLGVLLLHALRSSGIKGWKGIIWAFCLAVLYAASDEYHQSFIPGRGPQLKDVGIDSAGAFVGIVLYMLMIAIINRKKQNVSESR
ncbi:VanZ family protein [Ornithinibacillus halophilus]|uniref:VanZ like family protein n=1 Tax=Ornithinibacillus halophilus TaxID=930117 RepID=A0A1M5J7P6_9BACI|nr:VanZ family protein [Ornithinibacillus halophilus]SHG36329.1 VanZ like family protein [Ornithinibacillus halophilus]